MIFFKKDKKLNLEERINFAVFPSTQGKSLFDFILFYFSFEGGPHNNIIAGVAVQLKEVHFHMYES